MNRLPAHNPYLGNFHHGPQLFKEDHPYYLYKYRHNASLPMMAHSPPTFNSFFREIIPFQTVLPLFIYTKNDDSSEWVMVDPPQATDTVGDA